MNKHRHIFGLIFLALALSLAFSTSPVVSLASASQMLDESKGPGSGGGFDSGDPDMPDTQPPPPSPTLAGGRGGLYSGAASGLTSPTRGTAVTGSSARTNTTLRLHLLGVWQAMRMQWFWF